MKRAKRLYTLLGILAVVSVLTFCVLNYQEKQEEIKASGEVVLSIDPEEVTAFSWEYEALDPLSFHKDESWIYDEDSTFPVDEGQITSLLEQFRNFSAAFIIEDVTDYGQYGLDDPICTIHITAGDTDYEILLGNYSTMDSQRYVSTGDGNVYLASSDPLSSFNCTIRDLIANDETPAFGTVKGIEFAGEDSYTVTTQEYTDDNSYTACVEDYYYKADGDTLLPLDSDRVEDYLRGIAGLSLTNYVTYNASSEDLSVYGLDNPERTITVRYTDGTEDAEEETFTLSISRDPEEKAAAESDTEEEDEEITAYARVGESEIVYQLTQSEYESLMACSYDDLRHDEAFTAGFDRVTSVDITLEGTDYTITSEGDDEERTFYYGEEEVDLGDLRSALADARATEFTSEAPTQKEEIRLTLHLDSEAYPQTELVFYRYDGDSCLAVVDGSSWALVPREAVVDLIEAVNAIVL